jgi:hypothetical protein
MNEKIAIEIQYNIDDYVQGLEFIKNKGFFYKNNYLITGAIAFITFVIFNLPVNKDGDGLSFTDALMVILALMLIIPVIYVVKEFQPFAEKSVVRQYKSSLPLQESQTISFAEDGIESKSDSSANKIDWNAVIETAETDKGFFFFTSSKMGLFIPKRILSVEQQHEIKNLAKIKLGDKAKF